MHNLWLSQSVPLLIKKFTAASREAWRMQIFYLSIIKSSMFFNETKLLLLYPLIYSPIFLPSWMKNRPGKITARPANITGATIYHNINVL